MANYSLSNFLAQPVQGDKVIKIYDVNKKLKYEVNPNISYFFTKSNLSIIRIEDKNDIYLDFPNAVEASTATSKLNDAKKYLLLNPIPYVPEGLSESEQRRFAYFHALSKTMTSNIQKLNETKYKSSHTIFLNDIWSSDITPCSTYNDAVEETLINSAVTLHYQVRLTPISDSNNQSWYYNSGGTFIKFWINPVDVPFPITNLPSEGFSVILYRGSNSTSGIPNSIILPTEGAWMVDYYAGIIHFAMGYTPQDMGWGDIKITFFQYTGIYGIQGVSDAFTSVNFNSGTSQLIFNSGKTTEQIVDLGSLSGTGGRISHSNIDMTCLTTVGDNVLSCIIGITSEPLTESYVSVYVNGIQVSVGNGVKNTDCYFSDDGGISAKIWNDIKIGDLLYWNSSISGYNLNSLTDKISFIYLTP